MRKIDNKVVYRHRRLDTNEIFYIGMGYLKRAYSKDAAKRNQIWNRIVNKTEYEIEIVAEDLDWNTACELEILLIQEYGLTNLSNFTLGGEGCLGYSHTEEFKTNLSKLNSERVWTKESRDKISETHTGKTMPESFRKQMSERFKNNNPRSIKVINTETNIIYQTITEVYNLLNFDKSRQTFISYLRNNKIENFKIL